MKAVIYENDKGIRMFSNSKCSCGGPVWLKGKVTSDTRPLTEVVWICDQGVHSEHEGLEIDIPV